MQIPRMFAALFMITCTGILIFLVMTGLSHLILRKWHESAVEREG
jgi:NitT/TauT family transport system permease protein